VLVSAVREGNDSSVGKDLRAASVNMDRLLSNVSARSTALFRLFGSTTHGVGRIRSRKTWVLATHLERKTCFA